MSNYIFWVSVPVHDLISVGLCLDWISLVPVKQPTRILVNTSHNKKMSTFRGKYCMAILNLKSCGCEYYIGHPRLARSYLHLWCFEWWFWLLEIIGLFLCCCLCVLLWMKIDSCYDANFVVTCGTGRLLCGWWFLAYLRCFQLKPRVVIMPTLLSLALRF